MNESLMERILDGAKAPINCSYSCPAIRAKQEATQAYLKNGKVVATKMVDVCRIGRADKPVKLGAPCIFLMTEIEMIKEALGQ